MTDIPTVWTSVLKFALKNKGWVKSSSFNHIEDSTDDRTERKYILDCMAEMGYFTASKPAQVYVYTLTEKGRQAAAEVSA